MRSTFVAAMALVMTCTAVTVAEWQSRGTAVVSGVIVTDAANPQPVRRATVRLTGDAGTSGRLAGTDDNGKFSFDGLSAGTYMLSATKPGYVQAFYGSKRPGRGPGVPLAVADAQRIDLTLRILPGAAITGTITDAYGNPAPGVAVAAVETRPVMGPALPPVRAATDDQGTYRLFGLAPGEYLISASPQLVPTQEGRATSSGGAVPLTSAAELQWARNRAAGNAGAPPPPPGRVVAYAPVFFPGTTNAGDAAVVRVQSGEERTGVGLTLQLVPMSRIAGTLVDEDGNTVTVATVGLYPRRRAQPSPADVLVSSGALTLPRATVSAAGFVFNGVAPGEYTLVARTGSGQRGAVPPPSAAAPVTLWNVTDLVVDGSDRSDLALRLQRGLTLEGRIDFERTTLVPPTDYPVEVSLVALNPIPGVAVPRAVRKNDVFTFSSIPPGAYVLRANLVAALSSRADWVLKSAMVNRRDLADRPIESIATGEEIRSAVVTLSDRVSEIAGRLLDADNRPVTQYWIAVFTTDKSLWLPNARRIQSVQPATDGSFSVKGLPAGEYAPGRRRRHGPRRPCGPSRARATARIRLQIDPGRRREKAAGPAGQVAPIIRRMRRILLLLLLAGGLFGPSTLAAPRAQCRAPLPPPSREPNIFTAAQETDLGDAVAERFEGSLRIIEDDALTANLRRIGDRLVAHLPPTELKIQFRLVDIPDANAFVLPGGRIYVSRKLIGLTRTEDELAGVLGHELGHLVARQVTIAITKQFKEVLNVTALGDRQDVLTKYNRLMDNAGRKPGGVPRGQLTRARIRSKPIALASSSSRPPATTRARMRRSSIGSRKQRATPAGSSPGCSVPPTPTRNVSASCSRPRPHCPPVARRPPRRRQARTANGKSPSRPRRRRAARKRCRASCVRRRSCPCATSFRQCGSARTANTSWRRTTRASRCSTASRWRSASASPPATPCPPTSRRTHRAWSSIDRTCAWSAGPWPTRRSSTSTICTGRVPASKPRSRPMARRWPASMTTGT